MGQDYAARKAAKKRRKVEGKEAGGAEKRDRRRNKTRRACRGPCFAPPTLSEEDVIDLKESGEARAARRLAEELARGSGDADADAGGKRKRKRQVRPAEAQYRLSTSTQAEPAAAAADEGGSPKKRKTAAEAEVSAALRPFPPLIQRFMMSKGFYEPTPVQERCWPVVAAGRDVLGVAQPGSGKTLAFLLPAAVRMEAAGHRAGGAPDGPALLVLEPTRELAQQVAAVSRELRRAGGFRSACLYGGVDPGPQAEALARCPHVVVGTPGRLLDLQREGTLRLGGVQIVVLDEADKMLSLGLAPHLHQLRALLLPPPKAPAAAPGGKAAKAGRKAKAGAPGGDTSGASRPQVLLFSATMPDELSSEAAAWLHCPARITLSADASCISRSIVQVVQVCAEHKKPAKLLKHLRAVRAGGAGARNAPRVLIFANRVKTVRFIAGLLAEEEVEAVQLHGERSQAEREEALTAFRAGKVPVMVATDVAARGLHIAALPFIVMYDFPSNLDTYIHRCGRTGRLAAHGHCYAFLTRNLAPLARPLLQLLAAHEQTIDPNLVRLADAYDVAAAKLSSGAGGASGEDGEPGGGSGEDGERQAADGATAARKVLQSDVLATLGLRSRGQKDKARKRGGKRAAAAAAAGAAAAGSDSDSGGSDGKPERLARSAPQAPRGGAHEGWTDGLERPAAIAGGNGGSDGGAQLPPFFASSRFKGARAGYVFKVGQQGLGYYQDRQPPGSGGGSAKAGGGKGGSRVHEGFPVPPAGLGVKVGSGSGSGVRRAHKALPGRIRKKLAGKGQ